MNEYTCFRCKETYLNPTPDYLKVAEAERNFGKFPTDAVSLCDDCYNWFMNLYNKLTEKEKREIERNQ
jgi:hypothetical protein